MSNRRNATKLSKADVLEIVGVLERCTVGNRMAAYAQVAAQTGYPRDLIRDIANGTKYRRFTKGGVKMQCDHANSLKDQKRPMECKAEWFQSDRTAFLLHTRPWNRTGLAELKGATA